jgi:enoyl-CoA hydratase/carnithine racemase
MTVGAAGSDGGSSSPIVVEQVDESILRIWLNRPEKRNAMNREAQQLLIDALDGCPAPVKVILLTGVGSAFCAGIDLKEARAEHGSGSGKPPLSTLWRSVQERIRDHRAIVVAAVNGHALGGGLTLINSADLAIAAQDARIGMPEITFGIYPALAGPSTQLRTSAKRSSWLVLTGEIQDARTAERWGLVNAVVPADDLQEASLDVARRIARFDGTALELSKQALWTVPARITEWSAAPDFGEGVNVKLRERRSGADE